MNNKFIYAAVLASAALAGGCVDSAYDLSQIDGTSEFKVNNLVLPLNVEEITLKDLVKEGEIKVVSSQGKEFYAVTRSGTFSTDPVGLNEVSAIAPIIPSAVTVVNLGSTQQAPRKGESRVSVNFEKVYDLTGFPVTKFSMSTFKLDDAIIALHSIRTLPMDIKIRIEAQGVPSAMTVRFNEVVFQFLKGLTLTGLPENYSYDAASGVLKVTGLECEGGRAVLPLTATGINLEQAGATLQDGVLRYSGDIQLQKLQMYCRMQYDPLSGVTPPTELRFEISPEVGNLTATHASGRIGYTLSGDAINIPPVEFGTLPEFLNSDRTDLRLANPQIYLKLNNPLAGNRLYYQTGVQIRSNRDEGSSTYPLDNNGVVKVNPMSEGPYYFVLSPQMPAVQLPEYATNSLEHVSFTGLSEILSGKGLPRSIDIQLVDPQVPPQDIADIDLSWGFPGIEGSYSFLAPIALKKGSEIFYGETFDGWDIKWLEDVEIDRLTLEADVTSTLPLGFKLGAMLMEKGSQGAQVSAETRIDGNAVNQHITLSFAGSVRNLGGIRFDAMLTPDSEEALAPGQTVKLSNIRVVINGAKKYNIN